MKFRNLIFILFFVSSCQRRDIVEIYLLKEVKPNKIGVKYASNDEYDTTTHDSVTKAYYKWTDFEYMESDLNKLPFISDLEIVSLDTLNGIIQFNNAASQRIIKNTDGFQRSKQFVITVNNQPVMNGYFHNIYSSYGTDWNTIRFEDLKNIDKKDLEVYNFSMYLGKGLKNNHVKDKIYFNKYPLLIDALEETDRIK